MIIIGCDFHTRFQQIAMLETETGEVVERRLEHETGEAREFYAALPGPARVGMEATGYARWFERMLGELKHELWIGDAAEIRARVVRKQKTDARDALHILDLLIGNRFPKICIAKPEDRDAWQLLRHRDKLVRFQTSVRNQLHALAMGEGICRKKKLWSPKGRTELEGLLLGEWAMRRRKDLLEMLDRLGPSIEELDQAVKEQVEKRPGAVLLKQQPGVGPVTALVPARRDADGRRGQALSEEPATGQLRGIESEREQQRRQAAAGFDQQARKFAGAVFVAASGADGIAKGRGIAAGLPTVGVPPRQGGG